MIYLCAIMVGLFLLAYQFYKTQQSIVSYHRPRESTRIVGANVRMKT